MKHWQETRRIARQMLDAGTGQGHLVATVVRIDGSAYRRPGAKLLVAPEGDTVGGVSGGCLEADVREVARGVLRDGVPVVRRYDTGAGEGPVWGLGLGCEGTVEIFLQPVTPDVAGAWRRAAALMERGAPFVLATTLSGPHAGRTVLVDPAAGGAGSRDNGPLPAHARACLDDRLSRCEVMDGVEIFFDVLTPPPWLVMIGAGDDAVPLQQMAALLGFRTAMVDHRAAYVAPERYPSADRLLRARFDDPPEDNDFDPASYAVVMTHSLVHDRGWVERLMAVGLPYIGVLGPRARVRRMLDEMGTATADRVFGPVGLDIGAEGAEQIAVAVLAEILAVRAARQPQHLRDRAVPIHAG